ncbi:MAG TPA: choice-of-anchor D domain-containing protein [Candidatus Sulfopaludibacter sp.]|nr:choice-of-anchor D domain-containing protein [Candidatus Sulfopaludibacter sp.]
MMRRVRLLLAALSGASPAQFQLSVVNGAVELRVPATFDLGNAGPADVISTQFRVRNVSTAPATVSAISLAGAGFTIPSPPGLPQTLDPQAALDFTVRFQASAAGAYSAGLTLPGISVILTATVVSQLTFVAPSPIDFGAVVRGSSATVHVGIENLSTVSLPVPLLVIYGDGFSLVSPPPAGSVLDPQQSTGFDVRFAPVSIGSYAGSLTAGNRTFVLTGRGVDPPPPKVLLSVDLAQAVSGAQGSVRVSLSAPAPSAAAGTLTLDFQGAADPAVAFASGGRSVPFTVQPGDTQAPAMPFQTGTTAGTLVFTATLGSSSASQSVVIAPAAAALSGAQASRSNASLTVQLTGFDNTRTAGPLSFTFYDRSGNTIPPSPIQASADFADFFQTSNLGGLFLLKAVFPVYGDPAQVAAFDVQMTNSAGVASTGRTNF